MYMLVALRRIHKRIPTDENMHKQIVKEIKKEKRMGLVIVIAMLALLFNGVFSVQRTEAKENKNGFLEFFSFLSSLYIL